MLQLKQVHHLPTSHPCIRLPDKTVCVAGFGLYDIFADVFVQSRNGDTANIECRVCPSGHFSEAKLHLVWTKVVGLGPTISSPGLHSV